MAKSLKNSQKVDIKLSTSHMHDGEIDQYHIEKQGEITNMNGHYYMRYSEQDEAGEIVTTIKLAKTGTVTVIRHAAVDSRMLFDKNASSQMTYHTPYGSMEIEIDTHQLDMAYQFKPFAGKVQVGYTLYTAGNKLGDYTMHLVFTV